MAYKFIENYIQDKPKDMYNDLVTIVSYIHKQGKIYVNEKVKNLV